MQDRLATIQASGGEEVNELHHELERARDEARQLRGQLSEAQQALSYETEKLTSLEATMGNLTSGHEEQVARERQAAEERAAQQREREAQHSAELKQLDDKAKALEERLRAEMRDLKGDWNRQESEMKDQFDQMRKAKDREIDTISRYSGERGVIPLRRV